ncbi:hypothetical protein Q4566_08905 [Tamlana sp. 2_MG-2023]|uniref:hypothetical protein n=1 Tax=unclassified Tamlana TaxID=2614803 RepID=UPI0026E12C57|nr:MULTISPECIES: hypothetical protein [unclassified Tamlana]MDO6760314.1 hypothetical protein [Tamlana sp. 2_MG-2023]MDO6789988.1 hypothetical protein [Tamlana sp. 1_MG-2023]
MKRVFLFFLIFSWALLATSQSIDLFGKIKSDGNIENIHVINKTQQLFTTTNVRGEFTMTVKLNDTLMFSSIQHKPQEQVVSEVIFKNKIIVIHLESEINELEEVVLGKVLTGNLMSDISNTTGEVPINFYDVGIPGYTGKPATKSERLLDASRGGLKPVTLINAISGHTRELKAHVEMERKSELLRKVKLRFSETFFELYNLPEDKRNDFFYFCEEDDNFEEACQDKTDFEIFQFLEKKYNQYIESFEN